MKNKLEKRRQELRIEEAILSALPVGTDLGVIVAALANVLAENTGLLAAKRRIAGGAPDPLLLQDAAELLYGANNLVLAVVKQRSMGGSWEEAASAWNSQFAGWAGRYARHGVITIDKDGVVLAADAGGTAVGEVVSVTPDDQVVVRLGNG